jgi:hypothetical protein
MERNCEMRTDFVVVAADVAEISRMFAHGFERLQSPDYAQIATFGALDVILGKEGDLWL